MNLAQVYSLSCGAKIDKAYIFEKYFPLPFDKYIILHPQSKSSKTYDLFVDSLQIIAKHLAEVNLKVIQIGDKDDKPITGCYHLMGKTDHGQCAYLIRNCQLLLGVDSFSSHFAGHYDKKMVILYTNNFISNVKPYWGTPANQRLLEPPIRDKVKPSFSFNESPKSINLIDPEIVAQNVCELLDLPFTRTYKTLWMGDQYLTKLIEIIPNKVADPKRFKVDNFIVRMDFEFNEQNLSNQLQVCPCVITTNRPIDIKLIKHFRGKIKGINYILDENQSPKFAEELFSSGVQYNFLSYLSEEEINKLKIDYMDYGLIHKIETEKPKKITNENLFYKSGKLTLSNGRVYPSYAAVLENKPLESLENVIYPVDFTDKDVFWKESAHFVLLTNFEKSLSSNND